MQTTYTQYSSMYIYVNDKDDLYFLITLNVQQSNFQYLINSVCEIIILV